MAEIKPISQITEKWGSNSSRSTGAYTDGVNAPRRSWSQMAAASDQARKDGLAAADARDAFVTGVQRAGDQKWKANATTLGPARFSQGVSNAKPSYQSGFAKYHGVIAGVTLPPRGQKGSPENIERVRIIASALHTAKTQG